ncbi:MAG: ABC transporter substrate-binding protein [Verrucomicrobia bacterium]|nr:ABC transporter substrate-binding protein [Verrucomicrobiota bacterium]
MKITRTPRTRNVFGPKRICEFAFVTLSCLLLSALSVRADEAPLKIGVLVTLTGPFAQLGADGADGIKLAVDEFGGKVAGRPIQIFTEDSAADPDKAIEKTRALVKRDGVQLILGPLSGAEGEAVKKNSDEWPNTTIVVAGAAAEDITMRGVKPNVWRTSYTGAQPMFPLGEWAVKNGYKRVAIVAEDYAFPYAQVGGFMLTYCHAGGKVAKKFWIPLGTSDYSAIFPQLPPDIDAVYVALGGTDAVNFVKQMQEFGLLGKVKLLGGTVTVDASQLASVGELMDGIVSGSIFSGDLTTPEFKAFDQAFEKLRQRPPSLFAENYYRAAKWAFLALQKVGGKIEDQQAFRDALQGTSFNAPASPVSFDQYHNVVTDVYLNQVKKIGNEYRNSVIQVYPKVSQFWTFSPEEYQKQPSYGRNFPDCP